MANHDRENGGIDRRYALECMIWAGTGVLWTLSGGIPKSIGLVGEAAAAESTGFSFLQISDSHIGFNKPQNPNALGTLQEAIGKVKAIDALVMSVSDKAAAERREEIASETD